MTSAFSATTSDSIPHAKVGSWCHDAVATAWLEMPVIQWDATGVNDIELDLRTHMADNAANAFLFLVRVPGDDVCRIVALQSLGLVLLDHLLIATLALDRPRTSSEPSASLRVVSPHAWPEGEPPFVWQYASGLLWPTMLANLAERRAASLAGWVLGQAREGGLWYGYPEASGPPSVLLGCRRQDERAMDITAVLQRPGTEDCRCQAIGALCTRLAAAGCPLVSWSISVRDRQAINLAADAGMTFRKSLAVLGGLCRDGQFQSGARP